MNTRLQVEHPVTEKITAQDLVEWQLRVASGEPLPRRQEDLAIDGWAMEARLYAEDPAKGFLPSIGRLDRFDLGSATRVDTGVEQGSEISPFYDPMIAKVIAWGTDREDARATLAEALDGAVVWPVRSNAGFLVKALDHPDFIAANLDTGLITREGDALMPPTRPGEAALARAASALVGPMPMTGFRLNSAPRRSGTFLLDGEVVTSDIAGVSGTVRDLPDGLIAEGGQVWRLTPWRVSGVAVGGADDGSILSPMPGRIIAVVVTEGATVKRGQKLVTLEAMKMEHSLVAPFDGVVAELNATEGGQVSDGMLLVRIEKDS
jgi:3-methylcrotonyl-CoA carboxylase alpha subunit